jgi:heptosyltransferase-1
LHARVTRSANPHPASSCRRDLPQSLLVVRLGAIGDIIHAMPAVAALRRAQPRLRVGWLIEERWSGLLCSRPAEYDAPPSPHKPLVDTVHTSNFAGWRRALLSDETWREARDCLREVRSRRYEAVLDLQGAIRSSLAAVLSDASVRIGSAWPREAPARLFYTRAVAPEGAHVIEQGLEIASALAGHKLAYAPPVLPCDEIQERWADEFLAGVNARSFAILNPGAGWGAKCWPAESFGAVARVLHERGVAVLINHGPGEESLASEVLAAGGDSAHLLKCSVSELIAITRRARLFLGGDTGPMHLAAALGVPVVALFGPTRPERNGPYGIRSIVLRSPASVDNRSHVADADPGLVSIRPAEVIAAVDGLLGGELG